MSYPEVGIDGEVNPCYFFMREVENCYHNNLYPATNCKNEQSDFFECHKRGKQVNYLFKKGQTYELTSASTSQGESHQRPTLRCAK